MALGQIVIDPFANVAGYGQPVKEYAQRIAGAEQARRQAEGDTGIDVYKLGGAIASPLNLIAGSQVAKAGLTGVKGALATGGVTGALAQPTLEEDVALGKAKQAGIGAGAGVVGQKVGQAIGGVISPKVSVDEQILRDLGVTPTTGETLGGFFGEVDDCRTYYKART